MHRDGLGPDRQHALHHGIARGVGRDCRAKRDDLRPGGKVLHIDRYRAAAHRNSADRGAVAALLFGDKVRARHIARRAQKHGPRFVEPPVCIGHAVDIGQPLALRQGGGDFGVG